MNTSNPNVLFDFHQYPYVIGPGEATIITITEDLGSHIVTESYIISTNDKMIATTSEKFPHQSPLSLSEIHSDKINTTKAKWEFHLHQNHANGISLLPNERRVLTPYSENSNPMLTWQLREEKQKEIIAIANATHSIWFVEYIAKLRAVATN